MDFGLQRIILIDSYLAGRAAEVDVSGHTNISGTNAAGKTSFLKLMPIFYGENPRNLVVATASGNYSFTDWYLPREGSYLIYEYLNNGEPRMAVFCATTQEARFRQIMVDSPYREDLFMDTENGTIYPSRNLLTRLSGMGLPYYACPSTKVYRQVLLDGTEAGATQYSLCPRNGRMSKLTPLFTGMFKRDASFDDLAKVIQDYATDKLDSEAYQILQNFAIHRDHLTKTLRQYDAYQHLDRLHGELPHLVDHLSQFNRIRSKLSALEWAAQDKIALLRAEVAGANEALQEQEETAKREERDHRESLSEMARQENALEEKKGPVVSQKSQIERNKKAYDDDDLPHWKAQVEAITDFEGKRDGYRSQYAALSNTASEIEEPIKQEISKVKDRFVVHDKRISEMRKSLDKNRLNDYRVLNARQQQEAGQLQRQQINETAQVAKRQGAVALEITRLEERIKSPQVNPELREQLRLANAQFSDAQKAVTRASTETDLASRSEKRSSSERDRADTVYLKARDSLDELEKNHGEVLGLINGRPGSLIMFLNNEVPRWEDTLGKVLDTELLRRDDLSPSLSDDPGDSLCGVNIDFERLDEGELTPADLQTRLETLARDMEVAEEELNQAERTLNAANNRHQTDAARLQKAEQDSRSAAAKLNDIQETLEKITAKVRAEEQQQLSRLKTELAEAQAQHTALVAESESLVLAQTQEIAELQSLHQGQQEELEAKAQHEEDRLEVELAAAKQAHDESVSNLEAQLKEALEAGGINADELRRLENKANELAAVCRTIREKEATVRGYEIFMRDEFTRLDDLKADIAQVDAQLKALKSDRTELKRKWSERVEELEGQQNRHRATAQTGERDIQRLQRAELGGSTTPTDPVPSDADSLALYRVMQASQMVEEFSSLLRGESETRKQLLRLTERYASVFERYPGTTSADYWQEVQSHWVRSDDREVTRASAVVEYFSNNQHSLVKESLIHGFHNLDQVDIYRRAMEGFEKRIRKFNRELSNHIDETIPFNGIDSIEPQIAFELNDLDYWKDIKALADQVRLWREDDDLSLPGEQLVSVLREYLDTFEESRASVGVDELWRLIRFKFVVVENGHSKVATSPKELPGISSNGLSYLILIVLFQAFVDMHRRGNSILFHWALDELSNIDKTNKRHLLKMLRDHGISLITACPELESRDLGIFDNAYYLERVKDDRKFIRWRIPELGTAQSNPFAPAPEVTA